MSLILQATRRTIQGKQVKKIRADGKIPAVLYGHGIQSISLALDRAPFAKTYRAAGESSLIDVAIEDAPAVKALIHDIARHPLTEEITHVDLYQVRMDEKIKTDVVLKFVGDAPAVKELGGVLVKNISAVTVECLPKDLVHEIVVDLGALKEIHNTIRVKDIAVPAGLRFLANLDDLVITVIPAKTEEELKKELETPTAADVSQVEVVKKEKKVEEGEEGAIEAAKPEAKKEEKK